MDGVSQGASFAYVQTFYRLLTSLWPSSGCRKRKLMEASVPETIGSKFLKGMFVPLVHSFIHHTSTYLNTQLCARNVPCTGNTIEKKNGNSCPKGAYHLVRNRKGIRQQQYRGCSEKRNMGRPSSGLSNMHSFLEE